MLLVDAFFRFSGIGLMLFMCVFTIRDLKKSTTSVYFLLAFLSLSFYFLGFVPSNYEMPHYLRLTFRILDVPFLVFTWLFTLSLFKKDFRLTPFYAVIGIVYSFFILMERLVQFRFIDHLPLWWAWVVNLSSIALVLHLVIIALTERHDDLIEKRRKSRVYLVYITAIMTITVTSFSFYLLSHQQYAYLQPTANIMAIWPIIILVSYWLLSMKENSFAFDLKKDKTKPLKSRDAVLKTKLDKELIENKAYLENSLSIETLAKRLAVSGYRLREFINQTLGFDNFSTFINGYRIESIKKEFSNPEKSHIPILTIALNNGFNSLSTFNRAFKSAEGITPSVYRHNSA
ncbi:MAG: helix-turn-helix transcriptional regulator [Proteobacteria bacterium]|nr:helix-turn-helix transcriptional regulator [Pseudomonadota bacterium]